MRRKANGNGGSVLLLALLAMTVTGVLVGVAFQLSNQNARMTGRSLDRTVAQAAAEGALEYAFTLWRDELMTRGGPITGNQANALLGSMPVFDGVEYIEPVVIRALGADGSPIGDADAAPDFHNNRYAYEATARVRVASLGEDVEVGIRRVFEYGRPSVTDYEIYTDGDFELYRPAPMIFYAVIQSNGDVYVSTHYDPPSDGLTFASGSLLKYVGNYSTDIPPGGSQWSGTNTADNPPHYADGAVNQLEQVDSVETLGTGSSLEFDTTDGNPNNDGNRELIEPPVVTADYDPSSPIEQARMYNKAGLIVELTGPMGSAPVSGVDTDGDTVPDKYVGDNITITPANGTALTVEQARAIQNTITNSKPSGETIVYWTLHDKREGVKVDIANVDVRALKPAIESLGTFNDILYIHDSTSTGLDDKKAIRLLNGGVLPSDGLTVATENGLYIQGDFNTGTTTSANAVPSNSGGNPGNADSPVVSGYDRVPSAVIADAVMILSNAWDDAYAGHKLKHRKASHTTVNTAIIAGSIPSLWENPHTGEDYGYSGGINNFPRFLEQWKNKYFTFYGSMVQLFTSEMFIGEWDTGEIYHPPNRCWNYDVLFLTLAPPGTPGDGATYTRGRWSYL